MVGSGTHGTYATDDDVFDVFPSRRSVVHSNKGIVSTTSPLATEAGLQVLQDGGNAADAAVAAAAVLGVVDPAMTGIGGDVFCLFYDAEEKKVHALNGSGRSPLSATLDDVCRELNITDRAHGSIPPTSIHSVTVPGAAAAWMDIIENFGSGNADAFTQRFRALKHAIHLAGHGAPISEIASYHWIKAEEELRETPDGLLLLKEDPMSPKSLRAPRPGEMMRNLRLAKLLIALCKEGKEGFYQGPYAESMVEVSKKLGGYLTLDDFKQHSSLVTDPIPLRLTLNAPDAGIDLWEHPPNGQGIVAQMALGILAELEKQGLAFRFEAEDHNSTAYLHALIESLHIAFADGSWFITDPDEAIDPRALISPAYLSQRAQLFDPHKATAAALHHGHPPAHRTSDTVYLAVTDETGNACSLVNSVADSFGSRIVVPAGGFALQNRGSGFHLDPARPNAYAPGKRPYNTIVPALVTDAARDGGGGLRAVLGVMGGAMQPQGHVQVLMNLERFGMNPQVALDAPRVCVGVSMPGKSTDPGKEVDRTVYLEEGISAKVARELEELGHEIKIVKGMERSLFGRGQVIRVHHDVVTGEWVYSAGSDMRGDGNAAPLIRLGSLEI